MGSIPTAIASTAPVRQRNAIGDLRYTGDEGKAWLVISGDDQHLGLPGARLVDQSAGINELVTDRRGATTPTAFADKTGEGLTLGVSRTIGKSVELIVDGNLRRKNQTAFSTLFGFDTSDIRELTTASITPRAIIETQIFGLPTKSHDRHRLLQFNARGQAQRRTQ